MAIDMYPGTREGVLDQVLERILIQEDDNDRRHDGYQRRMVMVEGYTRDDADDACEVLVERVRNTFASKRHAYELSVMRCERPPGRRRYEFGPAHAHQVMKACGNEQATPYGALYTLYKRETWTEPKLLFIRNADAMGQAGRNLEKQWMKAGDFIRFLSDTTRVRQVLFGSADLRNIYNANECFRNRTDAYHLDPQENRRRLRASMPGISELNWRIASGSTLH